MKFVRFMVAVFPDLSEAWHKFSAGDDQISAGVMAHWRDEERDHLLLGCELDVTRQLSLEENEIVIPEDVLIRAEQLLESLVNRIAVLDGSKRTIWSPLPSGALVPSSDAELEWLQSTGGIRSARGGLQGFRYRIDATMQRWLQGRADGVALLAEALAHDHPTGEFHELLRLFERAFALTSTALASPLGRFLESGEMGYSVDESTDWVVRLRHPATHADRREEFVLERGIRPVLRRMEQAAYDVLFNKEEWRSPNTRRREAWKIPCGTRSPLGNDIFITQGKEMIMTVAVLDDFGSYPVLLKGNFRNGMPEDFWMKFTDTSEVQPNGA